ncbi:MAG: aspartate 1-decarboxylase [Spirochaetales bacterium]|nr:aspartate 1-decarboxylase [Spirochaetales bacterium]
MTIEMLKAKLHRATVTDADLNYEGSVSIDPALYKAVGMMEFEKVDILNINNGARLTTYIINGKEGEVCLNGAAARLVQRGDKVIICSYCALDSEEAKDHKPMVALLDEKNRIIKEGIK